MNFFSLGLPAGEAGFWYYDGAAGEVAINDVNGLLSALGGLTAVSTLGLLDADGNIVGIKINEDADGWDGSEGFLELPLDATQGYQVYLKADTSIILRNYSLQE